MDYNSRRWAAKRSSILKRDRYRCRECRRFGEAVDASVVHHVWPVENWPEYAWYASAHRQGHGVAQEDTPPLLRTVFDALWGPGGGTFSDGGKNGGGGERRSR